MILIFVIFWKGKRRNNSSGLNISFFPHKPEPSALAFLLGESMATKRSIRRPDQSGWAEASFKKARKIIYASQTNCGICGRPVNFDKKFPDPWSATLDHIVPVSKGGDPAALENLQLAHLQCNRAKASKLYAPQVKEKAVSNRDLPLSCDWAKVSK